jgi:hypothetical protein
MRYTQLPGAPGCWLGAAGMRQYMLSAQHGQRLLIPGFSGKVRETHFFSSPGPQRGRLYISKH